MTAPIERIISSDAQLAALSAHAQKLQMATRCLAQHLDPVILAHCAVARLEPGNVVIVADSAVWASRMRYLTPQLEALFRDYLQTANAPRVRIKVRTPPRQPPAAERTNLSDTSRHIIASTAEHLSDGPLKDALQRLASRRGSKKTR